MYSSIQQFEIKQSKKIIQDLSKLSVYDPETNQTIQLHELWKNNICVIKLMRRFGCLLCRLGASDASELQPAFDQQYGENYIRLIGIGHEEIGYEEFVKGNFFTGKIYLDTKKQIYKGLGLKRGGICGLLTAKFRAKHKEAVAKGFKSDKGGDGWQFGGTLVVTNTNMVIFKHEQEYFGDEPDNSAIYDIIEKYIAFQGYTKNKM